MARSALVMVCVAVAALAMAGMAWAAGCASGCPTIKPPSPAANATTFDATPEIAATLKDRQTNLAKKHIKLFVDGARTTTFSYDRAADRLSNTPAAALGEGGHTVKIAARDNAGGVGRKAWTFSVGPPDTTAPTIDTVSPTTEATGVAPETDVAVTFSEAMDPSTLSTSTFTLVKHDSSAPVTATVSYDPATNKATLDPAATALASNTTYKATLTTGVEDAAGNALVQERSWTFTIAETPTGVTVTPATLDLSTTDPLFCSPQQKNLTVTNNGPVNVMFADVSITAQDAEHFLSNSQSYIATDGPFTVLAGNFFQDLVTFRPGSDATDRHRDYRATLNYKDGTGTTIGVPVTLTATTACVTVG